MTLILAVLFPFLGAILPALFIRQGRTAAAIATATPTLLSLVLILTHAPAVFSGEVITQGVTWIPALGLSFTFFLDGLGLLFATLILFIGLLIILYARFYISKKDPLGQFFSYLLLFQGAMLGIVISDNVLLMVIFWELTSLSSFLLIGYWRHLPEGRQGARMALTVTGAGGLALTGGVLILGNIVGSYQLTDILAAGDQIKESPYYLLALILILGGAFTKSAQFPFHFWLPHAMAAPTPVSAYLHSATMVKAGIFLLARMWPALAGTEEWFLIVSGFGLVTMVVAAGVAIFKDDLKALLAFSTVSHLGLITMLFGFGTQAAALAGVLHIINHASFKAALFMSAGIVDHETHTRDAKRLGGLIHVLPITSTLAIVASLSMAGVPPFNGYLSKELMLEEATHAIYLGNDWITPLLAGIGALFSVAYSLRLIFHVFLGKKRTDYPNAHPHEPPRGMRLPVEILLVIVLALSLFPTLLAAPVVAVAGGAVTGTVIEGYYIKHWHGLTLAFQISLAAIAGGAFIIWLYRRFDAARQVLPALEAKAMFDAVVAWVVTASAWLSSSLHTGSLQRYVALILVTSVVVGIFGYLGGTGGQDSSLILDRSAAAQPGSLVDMVIWLALIGATFSIVFYHHNRLQALIVTGIVGLIVSLTFVRFSAPDLALTQISVEVVTVILFMLALNWLPKTTPRDSNLVRRIRDLAIAGISGLGVTAIAWVVMTQPFDPISWYHLANSKPEGGGTNVVNVILVDFRGYDTFGEITVLGIAALAIFALIDGSLRGPAGRRLEAWTPDRALAWDRHPMILVIMTRILLPFALLIGVYIFLRGHNEPGGGFISGLVVGIALIMQYMASGFSWANERMRIDYHLVIGIGLLAAGLTGIGAWFSGTPFLTSAFTYIDLPLVGEFEVATAALFDIGVFLTVVGVVVLSLANIAQLSRKAENYPEIPVLAFDPSPPMASPAPPDRQSVPATPSKEG